MERRITTPLLPKNSITPPYEHPNHLHSALRRNGKIARLPKPTRDLINHMLDDNLPCHVILDELGEAGEGISPQNLSNWVQGGYQDYLRQQERLDQARAQMEAATDLLRQCPEADPAMLKRACNVVAATLIFDTLLHHGSEALKKMVQANPAKILSLLHTECSLANASLPFGQSNLATKLLDTLGLSASLPALPAPLRSSLIKLNQAPAPLVEVRFQRAGHGGILPPVPAPPVSSPIKPDQASAISEDVRTAGQPATCNLQPRPAAPPQNKLSPPANRATTLPGRCR